MGAFEKFCETVKKYKLLEPGDKVLVAVSGGADSVCLLHMLSRASNKLKIMLGAAHLNHLLRGSDANEDMNFVIKFSEELSIPCFVKSVDVGELARLEGISTELAGREARYEFFSQILRDKGFNKIATAHNKNDQAETVLLHLIRGSGLGGLCAMSYIRGNIIRPLLDITKEEIIEYCSKNDIEYRTDKSNFETNYTRNRIRLEIMPKLEEINPSVIDAIKKTSFVLSEDNTFLKEAAENEAKRLCAFSCDEVKIDYKELRRLHPSISKRVIMHCAEKLGASNLTFEKLEKILDLAHGKKIELSCGYEVYRSYDNLKISKKPQPVPDFEYRLNINGETYIEEIKCIVECRPSDNLPDAAVFDADKTGDVLFLRNRRNGDRFSPEGMTGTKKLKDYFIDMKIPKEERSKIPIITNSSDIIWVVPYRKSRKFLCDAKTKRYVSIKIKRCSL